jgi:hypothetical protein
MTNRKRRWSWCQSCNFSQEIDNVHPESEEKCKNCTKKIGEQPSNYEYFQWP